MIFPQLIFIVIALTLIVYFIWSIKKFKSKKNLKQLLLKAIILILIAGFSWIWFVPMNAGQRGEAPICKFRFQVFIYEVHDYGGYGDFQDIYIKTIPAKYGERDFYEKIGGWKEYFGIKSIEYQTREEYLGKDINF